MNTDLDQADITLLRRVVEDAWLSLTFAEFSENEAEQLRRQIAAIVLELRSAGEINPEVLCQKALRRLPVAEPSMDRVRTPPSKCLKLALSTEADDTIALR